MHGVRGGDVLDVGGRDFQQRLRVLSCRCLVAARERDVIELQMQCGLYRVRRECVHDVRLGNIQEQCGRRSVPIMRDRLDIATGEHVGRLLHGAMCCRVLRAGRGAVHVMSSGKVWDGDRRAGCRSMLWELPERFDFSRRELSIDALRMQHGVYRARWRRLFGMRGWFVQRADGVIWMHRVWSGDVLDIEGRHCCKHVRGLPCKGVPRRPPPGAVFFRRSWRVRALWLGNIQAGSRNASL